tara:strand:+ start:7208 stop:7396 length:189 start_codon:yes stop_codon:yes gene_type:complete
MDWFDIFRSANLPNIKKILARPISLNELSDLNSKAWVEFETQIKNSKWKIPNAKQIIERSTK